MLSPGALSIGNVERPRIAQSLAFAAHRLDQLSKFALRHTLREQQRLCGLAEAEHVGSDQFPKPSSPVPDGQLDHARLHLLQSGSIEELFQNCAVPRINAAL